ncbi:hypothetical protein J4467_00685 [Candidatus Woesearchaeota archaeon]|nr:hypothetical protein [Candidatus Woesearchaeota archaeon]
MIDFTETQVRNIEILFRERNYSFRERNIGCRNFGYYFLPSEINPELSDFILRITNQESKLYVIGVSESVPFAIRDYFALAEYIEFIELDLGLEGRVRQAEEIVLGIVEPELKRDYITKKLGLYKRELDLDRSKPEEYCLGDEGRREFLRAIDYLDEQLAISRRRIT